MIDSKVTYLFIAEGTAPEEVRGSTSAGEVNEPGKRYVRIQVYDRHARDNLDAYSLKARIVHETRYGVQFEEGRLAFEFIESTQSFIEKYYDLTDEVDAYDAQLRIRQMEIMGTPLFEYSRMSSDRNKKNWLLRHGYGAEKGWSQSVGWDREDVPDNPPAYVWHN